MPGTGIGLFMIDFVMRPFAKIIEKMPVLCILLLIAFYAVIAYIVLRSAYVEQEHRF